MFYNIAGTAGLNGWYIKDDVTVKLTSGAASLSGRSANLTAIASTSTTGIHSKTVTIPAYSDWTSTNGKYFKLVCNVGTGGNVKISSPSMKVK